MKKNSQSDMAYTILARRGNGSSVLPSWGQFNGHAGMIGDDANYIGTASTVSSIRSSVRNSGYKVRPIRRRGVISRRLQVFHAHVFLVAPLGAGRISQSGADRDRRENIVGERSYPFCVFEADRFAELRYQNHMSMFRYDERRKQIPRLKRL